MTTTYCSGEIDFSPPITREDLADAAFTGYIDDTGDAQRDVSLLFDGRGSDTLIPSYADESVMYSDVQGHVQEFVDTYGEGRTFTGYIYVEDCDDLRNAYRIYVIDGKAVKIAPVTMWLEDVQPLSDALHDGTPDLTFAVAVFLGDFYRQTTPRN